MNFGQKLSLIATSVLAALLIVSCGKKEEEAVSVSSVAVSPVSVEITEGESTKLTAKISPAAAADRTVTWTSSNKAIATVDGSGNVQGIKAGTATITASAEGKSGKSTVTVKTKVVNVAEVSLDRTELTLTEVESANLTATVKPDNATNKKVTWKSDKADIASVDGNGKVTALKAGEANITVSTEDGGKTAECKVTVKSMNVPVSGVEINPWAVNLSVKGTAKLTYTIKPADATNQRVKWESDTPSVATVDAQGNVKGIAAGTAKICVTTDDGGFKSYCTITVKKAESKFEVGGLWYEYYSSPNLVQVIPDPDGSKYSGNITIPGQVEYDGVTYSVKRIWNRAFYMCTDLKTVTLGEGIEYIDSWAFYNCSNLERITFASTMRSFNTDNPVFEGCPKLEIVTTPKTSESQRDYFYTHDGALYSHCNYASLSKETEILSWLPEKTTDVFAIKEGVEAIDEYSITCTGIDKIIIPESVKYM